MTPIHPLDTPSRWHRIDPLAGDASTRKYSRLQDRAGRTWVLAAYPGESRRTMPRDLEVLSWMHQHGLRVPAIIEHDLAGGWMMIEDFGIADAEHTLRTAGPQHRVRLFDATLAPLVTLARLDPTELPAWNRPLEGGRLRWELSGFELWFVVGRTGRPPRPELTAWLDSLAQEISGHPLRVCHRDYHLNNLFFIEGGNVGMIDVQDVLVGPDTYDAASLIAERAAPELIAAADRQRWLERWAKRTAASPGWRERIEKVRVQRALKVLGTFARLMEAGDLRYRPWLQSLTRELADEADRLQLHPHLTELLVD
jgi:aminoglycoside/choline kinase family phosphotransferase